MNLYECKIYECVLKYMNMLSEIRMACFDPQTHSARSKKRECHEEELMLNSEIMTLPLV